MGDAHHANARYIRHICASKTAKLVHGAQGQVHPHPSRSAGTVHLLSSPFRRNYYMTTNTPQVAINDIGSEADLIAAIDETIKYFNDGDIVEGTVVKVDHDEVLLDIGYKTEGVILSRELSIKHDVNPDDVVAVGDQIEALVLQKEDKEGRLLLSKKRAQYERAWGKIEKVKEEDGVVTGTVIEVVKGGLILDIGLRGSCPPPSSRCVASATSPPTSVARSKRRSSNSTRTATTWSCPAAHGSSRPSPRSARTSCTPCRRARCAPASFPPSSTSARSSISVASTAWFTSPSCPGSTSTTRPRLSRLARKSPSRFSTSTWIASASPCRSRPPRKIRGRHSPAPTPSARLCPARSPSWSPSARFVRVEDGIEGLVHISELAQRHVELPDQVVKVGEEVFVKVIDIDLERRRISLSLKQANEGVDPTSEEFDPSLYGMAAEYDENGNYKYPKGFDPETQEWMEGFDAQREAWEAQYAEAQARWEAHKAQVRKALEEDAEAAPSIEEQASYSTRSTTRAPLLPTRPWPRCVRS